MLFITFKTPRPIIYVLLDFGLYLTCLNEKLGNRPVFIISSRDNYVRLVYYSSLI